MAAREPRALFIAPATPARSSNGLAMRLGVFHDALSAVMPVDMLVVPISGPPPDGEFSRAFGGSVEVLDAGRSDTQFEMLMRLRDPAERLAQFRRYGRGSRHARLTVPLIEAVRLRAEAGDYRLIHTARLYLADAVIGVRTAGVRTLDLDEDDAWAWRRLAATQPPDHAEWSNTEAEAEDRLLARAGPMFDRLFVAGPTDAASLAARHPGLSFEVADNAIAFPPAPERRDDGRTLVFVGAFGYAPNVEGILWFVREVWPSIMAGSTLPPRLRLVGRAMPDAITQLAGQPGIEVVGAVDDLAPVYAEATLAIAPLHTGAGTRLKLIEAAAHQVPVVTTNLAARGLAFATPETVWFADDAPAFAAAVLEALADPPERTRRAGLAHAVAKATHERRQVVDRLASRFADMLARTRADRGEP